MTKITDILYIRVLQIRVRRAGTPTAPFLSGFQGFSFVMKLDARGCNIGEVLP